ncbi:MAG TPA: T9SS type A sorting domain-containing protein [Chitinophagaceae bacterium]|jgi:hypothetical protein|nr:T9SS type A sorting domain-containing protein [Chitinophagaceae bacterium]
MKLISFIFCVFIIFGKANAQQPLWLAEGNTNLTLYPQSGPPFWGLIANDAIGNVYVTGAFKDSVKFGNTTLTSSGDHDMFIAKMDSTGQWIWAKNAGGQDFDAATSIAVDYQGNVLICGGFGGSFQMGATTLTAIGLNDVFVAKLDSSGNWLWVSTAGGANADAGMGICTNQQGHVFVTGEFRDTLQAGAQSIVSLGLSDGFVGKLDGTNGQWQWLSHIGSKGNSDKVAKIKADVQGNLYLCGMFADSLHCGTVLLTNPSINPSLSNFSELFLAKMNDVGQFQWAISGGGYDKDQATSLAIDPQGMVYVCGYTSNDTIVFGANTVIQPSTDHLLVAAANALGQWQWVKTARVGSKYPVYDIAAPANGKVFVAGSFWISAIFGTDTLLGDFNPPANLGSSEVCLASIDGNGQWQGAMKAYGKGDDFCASISADNKGNIWLHGSFADSLRCGQLHLEASDTGRNEIFVLRLRDTTAVINGLAMHNKESFASLFPNPAEGNLTLLSSEEATWKLYNINGQLIWQQHCLPHNATRLAVSDWPRGIYYYVFQGKHGLQQTGLLHLD